MSLSLSSDSGPTTFWAVFEAIASLHPIFTRPATRHLLRPAPAGIERPGMVDFTPQTFSTLPAGWRLPQIEGPQKGGGGPPRGKEDLTDEHPR